MELLHPRQAETRVHPRNGSCHAQSREKSLPRNVWDTVDLYSLLYDNSREISSKGGDLDNIPTKGKKCGVEGKCGSL